MTQGEIRPPHQVTRALVTLEVASADATSAMATWCDRVCQEAERRMQVPAGDDAALDDPAYIEALLRYRTAKAVEEAIRVLVELVEAAGPIVAARRRLDRLVANGTLVDEGPAVAPERRP